MQQYSNLNGNSRVDVFEIGDDWIKVGFLGSGIYLYDYEKPGLTKVEEMKVLAQSGSGLNGYINRHVKKNYKNVKQR